VILTFTKIKYHINTPTTQRILQRTSLALTQERIQHTRHELDKTTKKLLEVHLTLAYTLTQHDWDMVDIFTTAKANLTYESTTTTQRVKFERLYRKKRPEDNMPQKNLVVNLTNEELEQPAIAVLQKGLNFAQTSSTTRNLKDSISGIEQAIQHLDRDTAEEL
jgi:hypothetical protein